MRAQDDGEDNYTKNESSRWDGEDNYTKNEGSRWDGEGELSRAQADGGRLQIARDDGDDYT